MILNDRPHILKKQAIVEGHEDADGNYIPGESQFIEEIPCRAVPNGKAAEIRFEDGEVYRHAYTIYLDLHYADLLKSNDVVRVVDHKGEKMLEMPVHGEPYVKQLHVKVYV
ncbi:MAG: hypothetical protein LBK45_02910 [Tannerellaceae bacterium]|jgi:hypothetical protein|nr:hypothetical protein [Tannerellaceae bacterium]